MDEAEKRALPYRPCVGVMLLNRAGLVWIGHRIMQPKDDEADRVGMWWQMPQGGVDEDEDLAAAAIRELAEETGVTSAEIIEESPRWYRYDLPELIVPFKLEVYRQVIADFRHLTG